MEEQQNKHLNRKMIIFIVGLSLTIFGFGMITYSFFSTSIDADNLEAVIDVGTMKVKFADGNSTINERLMLEEEIVKEFTIENTGDLDAEINIEWLDLINTYMLGSLTYTLEKSEEKITGYEEILSKTEVPVSNTEYSYTLIPDLQIPTGKTYYYRLRIKLNDLTVNQNEDINAILSTKFNATPVSSDRSYTLEIDPNGGILDSNSNIQIENKKAGEVLNISVPTRSGAIFKGWSISGYGSNISENTFTMGKSNTKLIAKWLEFNAVKAVNNILKGKLPEGFQNDTPNFSLVATTNEGVYAMEDDYGMSYYYRGASTNNYVKFGKWADISANSTRRGKDMYWRIIRINGDGSVRVRYDGIEAYPNGKSDANKYTTSLAFNSNTSDAKYLGWMYSPAGSTHSTSKIEAQTNTVSSNAKKTIDSWYETNFKNQECEQFIADKIFCNDRSTPYAEDETSVGYGTISTQYGAHKRILGYDSPKPKFKCPNKNDAFTVNDNIYGNNALTYPVGLITADELITAGTYFNATNKNFYLYGGYNSWTMSPFELYQSAWPGMFYMDSNGGAYSTSCHNGGYLSPVINLTSEYFKTLIGIGTIEDPFRESNIEP